MTHSSGVCGSASAETCLPFNTNETMCDLLCAEFRWNADSLNIEPRATNAREASRAEKTSKVRGSFTPEKWLQRDRLSRVCSARHLPEARHFCGRGPGNAGAGRFGGTGYGLQILNSHPIDAWMRATIAQRLFAITG